MGRKRGEMGSSRPPTAPTLAIVMKYVVFLLLLFLLPLRTGVRAQVSLFDAVHAATDTLELRIETDFDYLVRHKRDREFGPATVAVSVGEATHTLPARVRTRGNIRIEQCYLPALKLRFGKDGLDSLGFARELNDWKLVLPCTDNRVGETYLRREAFSYRLYALLHEHHLRTVPTRLTIDERELAVLLIEHPEQLAARYDGYRFPGEKLSSRSLEKESYVRLCLFNYLIQNTDFNVFNVHNIAVIGRDSMARPTVFPYDFDYSGLVGTNYAVPHESLGTRSVSERVWGGRHISAGEVAEQVAHFRRQRPAIEALIDAHFAGAAGEAKRVRRIMDSFFAAAERDRFAERLVRR